LAAVAANGGNVRRTAAQLGVPKATLQGWASGDRHPEASAHAAGKKPDMADALEAVAWKLIEALPGKVARASLSQTAVAAGIAIEKMRLLREPPTSTRRRRAP